jgi:hypothetical protein
MLPENSVDVAAFVADLEKRLAADEEAYSCCVCYEPFANAPLRCCHFLCPGCFEKMDTCPLCRVSFANERNAYLVKVGKLAPRFAFINSDVALRMSLVYHGQYEVCFTSMHIYVEFVEWSALNKLPASYLPCRKIVHALIDEPEHIYIFSLFLKKPLIQVPYKSVDEWFLGFDV